MVGATTSTGAGTDAYEMRARGPKSGSRNERIFMPQPTKALLALALPLVAVIAGCSAAPAPLSLREEKSTVQLLRNEASNQIPREVVGSIIGQTDISAPCGAGDPMRRWTSAVRIVLAPEHDDEAMQVYRHLVESYLSTGWTETPTDDQNSSLTSVSSLGVISLSTRADTTPSSILIDVTGPCVRTDGAGSPEVLELESTN